MARATLTKPLLVAAVIGVVAIATAKRRARRRRLDEPTPEPTPPEDGQIQWVDDDAPRRIRELANAVGAAAQWPGLSDFLAGVSYPESRGNSQAGSSKQNNQARGWFGMRPKSARLDDLGLTVAALKDEPTAVALAAWYAHRCRPYAAPGQTITWLALRRCWGLPSDLPKIDHPGYRTQLAKGLRAAGVDPEFMDQPAFPPGYSWPGVGVVFDAVGR